MKTIDTIMIAFLLSCNLVVAQDTMYVYKGGTVLYKQIVANIDSVTFKNRASATETVTDIDGNVYHTVTIGTQTWMVENLKTTKYSNGNGGTIPNVTSDWPFLSTGAYCNYNNDPANGEKYGRLYNWYAVNDSRKLAPVGWHIATDAEWTTLINYLIANGYNYDGTTNDNRVAKSLAANTDWTSFTGPGAIGNDLTKNNISGFTALPGGYRFCKEYNYTAPFDFIGFSGYWWSSSTDGLGRYLDYNSSYAFRNNFDKRCGFYVRCVKDK